MSFQEGCVHLRSHHSASFWKTGPTTEEPHSCQREVDVYQETCLTNTAMPQYVWGWLWPLPQIPESMNVQVLYDNGSQPVGSDTFGDRV